MGDKMTPLAELRKRVEDLLESVGTEPTEGMLAYALGAVQGSLAAYRRVLAEITAIERELTSDDRR